MRHHLVIAIATAAPPVEFCIFKAGVNRTTKGDFILDDAGIDAILAEYADHGADMMIDYDHAALSVFSLDPSQAGKAAGWFRPTRRGKDLWAVEVRWTPNAARALSEYEWRYISPAFEVDEQGRIVSLVNIAITNLPATKGLMPLVASKDGPMNEEQVKAALDALIAGDTEAAASILKDMIAAMAASAAAPASEEPMSADPAAEEMASEDPAHEDPKKEDQVKASVRELLGVAEDADIMPRLVALVKQAAEAKALVESAAKERADLDMSERKKLVAELISLGVEMPATAWKDPINRAGVELADRLASEPVESLRARVKVYASAPARKTSAPPAENEHGLTERQLQICKQYGCPPEVFASLKKGR